MEVETVKIAIVGLGVIGGSFAMALKAQDEIPVEVLGIDHDAGTIDQAIHQGAIDYGEMYNQTILQEADIVILTLYPQALLDFVSQHQDDFKAGALLTDATGVKGDLVEQIPALLPDSIDFVFGHPMAGKENKGYQYADGRIYQGANYLLTPIPTNRPENLDRLGQLFKAIGFKRVSQVSPELHDQMIAYTSQLCHVLAVALINSDDPSQETVRFVGDSYRELTRIAKINGPLWTELFLTNKEALLQVMDRFKEHYDEIYQAVQADDATFLEAVFNESTSRRIALEQDDLKLRGTILGHQEKE